MQLIKNAIFYSITGQMPPNAELTAKLEDKAFTPCGSQELSRSGWVPPSDLTDMLSWEASGGQLICLQKEQKMLPASVIKKTLSEKVKRIEHEEARKVYRKERGRLKDEIIMDLLPKAFSTFSQTHALILKGFIIVAATSHKQAEELLSHLRTELGSLPVVLPDVNHAPSAIMTQWLDTSDSRPAAFQPLDNAVLKDTSVENGTIRCKGQDLYSDEIRQHLDAGKRVTELAIEWDESLTFTLHEDLSIKKIKPTDTLKEKLDQDTGDTEEAAGRFEAELALTILEFNKLLPAVLDAFGGEAKR